MPGITRLPGFLLPCGGWLTGDSRLTLCLRNDQLVAQNQKTVTTYVATVIGSPGRARTYNNSVNSRVLCH
ncbi:MAG: hypothetical protein RSA65_11225, partial [Clostridia bacterium]